MIFHIGYVIPTTNSKFDPNILYPWQTWERYAKGKTLVGVNEDDTTFASAGLAGGEKTHKLTVTEMPSHTHELTGSFTVGISSGDYLRAGYGSSKNSRYTVSAGNNGAHNNLQPYVTVYYWRRTA